MQLRRIGDMLSAFGFVRFSCSLLIHCFVKPKRRRRCVANRRGSDAEDVDVISLPRNAVAVAKSAMAKATKRIRPLRPVGKPCMTSLLGFFLKKKQIRRPSISQIHQEGSITDSDVRHRRTVGVVCDAMQRDISESGFHVESFESLSSEESAYYPSDDSDTDGESFVFGDLSPRTSSECFSTNRGFNPTFYGMEISEEEDPWQRSEIRHIDSVVEKDARLKENAHSPGHQELLLNPAYGAISREESENGEVQTETKLKSLKSIAKAGVLALPTSTALVDTAYIGRTSINPTYGDVSSDTDTESDAMSEISWMGQMGGAPFQTTQNKGIENMGTLTWSNGVFSASEKSDSEQESNASAEVQIPWKPSRVDSEDTLSEASNSWPSPFLDASVCLEDVKLRFHKVTTRSGGGITKTLVTPISQDVFEDIDFKCPPLTHIRPAQDAKISKSTSSPKGCSNFLTTGLKQTRWALRWFSLLLGHVDIFASNKKK